MLNSLKDQFQDSITLSTRLLEEGVERQVKFATELMNISSESAKQICSAKSLTDVVDTQKSYLESIRAEVANLNTGVTTALKELYDSANEAVTTATQNATAKTGKKTAA